MRSGCILSRLGGHHFRNPHPLIQQRRFNKGDVLTREGHISETALVIKIGSVVGYRRGLDGGVRPIGIAGRGSTFGLMAFFGQPNLVSGIAGSAGRACEIPVCELLTQARQSPQLAQQVAATVARTFGSIAAWSEGMRVPGVVNQLAYAVLLLADAQHTTVVELPTHTALAELLGTTRETVARAMTALEKTGSIKRLERKRCEIVRSKLVARLSTEGARR